MTVVTFASGFRGGSDDCGVECVCDCDDVSGHDCDVKCGCDCDDQKHSGETNIAIEKK